MAEVKDGASPLGVPAIPFAPAALQTSLASAKSLIALQLLSRLVTFSLNQALVRLTTPTVFGTAAVHFDLVRDTLLFLSREAVRGVVTRLPSKAKGGVKTLAGRGGQTADQLRNLLFLPALLGLLLCSSGLPPYIRTLPADVTSQSSFYPALVLYLLSIVLELAVVEPISLFAQYVSLDTARGVRIRVKAEGTAVIVKAVVTVAWLAVGKLLESAKGGIVDGRALLGFAVGQLAYASVLAWVHVRSYWNDRDTWELVDVSKMLSSGPLSTAGIRSSQKFLDEPSRNLVIALSGQSLVKHILTTGDMIVVARTSPLEDQGGYAVASNYASLVARIVFQPVEESSRLYFAKYFTGTSGTITPNTYIPPFLLLACLVRASLFLLLLTPAFVPPLLPLLLPYMLPRQYLHTSAPRALHAYLTVYLPIMALNGILEAFFASTTNVNGLVGQSGAMVACSGVFAGMIALLSAVRGGTLGTTWPLAIKNAVPDPESGLVYANAVQMGCRIVFAGHHAWKLARVKLSGARAMSKARMGILPRWRTLMVVGLSSLLVRSLEGELPWQESVIARALVVFFSGVAGLACLGAFYLDERKDWKLLGQSTGKKDN